MKTRRNTVGPWFAALIERGLIMVTEGPHLGPEGVGRATVQALQELPTADGRPAARGLVAWRQAQKPRTNSCMGVTKDDEAD